MLRPDGPLMITPTSVIVTRPEPGLSETLAFVRERGWRGIAAPMLCVTPRALTGCNGPFTHVLVTSGQAIPSLATGMPPDIDLIAVGARTARRARDAGFSRVRSADGDATDLLQVLGHAPPGGRVLLATGAGLGHGVATQARASGWRVIRRIVYQVDPARSVPVETRRALRNGDVAAVLLFSAVTAQAWRTALGTEKDVLRNVRAITLSAAVAQAADTSLWQSVVVACRPDQNAMLDALGQGPLACDGIDHVGSSPAQKDHT